MFRKMEIISMYKNVADFLSQYPIKETDETSMREWKRSCLEKWDILSKDAFFTEEEYLQGTSILSSLLEAHEELAKGLEAEQREHSDDWSEGDRIANMEALRNRPQVAQRTEEWYTQSTNVLSASQFYVILRPGRTRALLVMEKASEGGPESNNRRTVVYTSKMNPFMWGIRFEPIVKQIYQDLTKTDVVDLGRLIHREDSQLAASPDGLVVKGPNTHIGRFVEFKAPVTRQILNKVPDEYMHQMQIQMEVGNVEECDYLEIKFKSHYGPRIMESPPSDSTPKYRGNIFIIGNKETMEPIRYEYSPLNDMQWVPSTEENEEIVECVPWYTNEWFTTTVRRSRTWFESVKPAIQQFWKDVEMAKAGTFIVPASTRKVKEKKCEIIEESPQVITDDVVGDSTEMI
jgi:hypothetical protein